MTYSLTGMTGLGTITSEESSKDSGLFQQPMPASDSTDALLLDLFGASRTITISGTYTVSDGTISTFIGQLDGLVNGNQSTKTYHSDKSNANYSVLVQSVSWKVEEGGVNKVDYSISMTEGSA